MSYKKRNITGSIEYLMNNFPAVAVLGARQVGKSTLIRHILPEVPFFDLERDSDFQRVNEDPALLLQEISKPIIFDEAQLSPNLFRALRVAIDQHRDTPGQFLISGSSSPQLLKQMSETLAGRVAIAELEPLSWHEIQGKQKSHSILDALSNPEKLKQLKPQSRKPELLEFCLHGGYPEPVLKSRDKKFFELWMENYIKTYVERDIRSLFPQLNLQAYKRFIQMLAFASGEILNAANFARSLDVSQPTIKHYLDIVEGTFLWRQIPSYQKNITKRVVKMPKGHIRDTGIINYFLRLHNVDDMKNHPHYGRIWEIGITEQIIKLFKNQLESINYYYYRTQNQAEIDLVLETNFGLIPIEIKAGSVTRKKQIITLERFVEEHNCPYGIVVNNADEIYKLSPSVYQIPAIYW